MDKGQREKGITKEKGGKRKLKDTRKRNTRANTRAYMRARDREGIGKREKGKGKRCSKHKQIDGKGFTEKKEEEEEENKKEKKREIREKQTRHRRDTRTADKAKINARETRERELKG